MGTRTSARRSAASATTSPTAAPTTAPTTAAFLPPTVPFSAQAPCGTTRACLPYRDEVLRHRVITADGHDFAVATLYSVHAGCYLTCAYPVQHGYLVLVRQALCETRAASEEEARASHAQLLRVLAEAGTGVVRARRNLAARSRAEHAMGHVGVAMTSLAFTPLAAAEESLVGSLPAR